MSEMEWRGIDEEEDKEDEELQNEFTNAGRDSIIFLIDATKPMFLKADEETAFDLCLKCAKNVMSNKIISSDKDLIGVVLFGTDVNKNSTDFKHIYILQDLDQPGAEKILEIEKLMKGKYSEFQKRFGHSTSFLLSDALWICTSMFSNCTYKLASKRILLFTNTDDPHAEEIQHQRQAKQKAQDLFDVGIELDLMHIEKPGEVFDVTKFYQDLIDLADDEIKTLPNASTKFDELLIRVRKKDHKKRTSGRIPFSIGSNFKFSVGIYNLFRQLNKPAPAKLDRTTNSELKTMRKTFLADTGEILLPSDVKKYQEYGGKKIKFDVDEVKQMKYFFDPGLVLMGFKPTEVIKSYYYIRPGHFLYPDEQSIKGSTKPFLALLMRCKARNVVPICRFVPRRNTPPKLVALFPQEEELDQDQIQITPPGFHLIYLPFADDIRKLDLQTNECANGAQIDKAKEIIKKLQFKFNIEAFENPVLQTHWANIEALALDRDEPETITDYTKPDHTVMEKRAGKLIEEFKELIYPEGYDPLASSSKRKATSSSGEPAKKKEKLVEVDIQKEAEEGKLEKLTVSVLKTFCQNAGIKTTNKKKKDLIDAIYEYLKIKNPNE